MIYDYCMYRNEIYVEIYDFVYNVYVVLLVLHFYVHIQLENIDTIYKEKQFEYL